MMVSLLIVAIAVESPHEPCVAGARQQQTQTFAKIVHPTSEKQARAEIEHPTVGK